MSKTTKNNCVTVNYTLSSEFRCPYNLKEVYSWGVKWDCLYVTPKEGDEEEVFEAINAASEFDFKRPDDHRGEICEEKDIGYTRSEEEEELVECDFCGKEEDPDEIIRGTKGEACGECRHLCD